MTPVILCFYGCFLLVCGIASVSLIGMKAKTALASGGVSGAAVLLSAYLLYRGIESAQYAGLILSTGLFGVFAWRSAKTLFKIFELLKGQPERTELNGKGIAFLIISLMAVVSIVVTLLQVMYLCSPTSAFCHV